MGSRLPDNNLISRDTTSNNLLDCSITEETSGSDEKLFVGVVAGVSLIVELYVVEIDQASDFFVDGEIASFGVVLVFEVRGLGGVGYCVGW